jgi:hypothetical protein
VGSLRSRSNKHTLSWVSDLPSECVRAAAVLMANVVFPIPPLGPMIEITGI